MAGSHDDELRRLEEEGALIAAQAAGGDAGGMASRLAGMQTAAMGAGVAERYAGIGARWLSDPVPTRLDGDLVDRLTRMGFRRESLADVRIHRGTKAQDAADALGARAFAVGDQDIFFGRGEFDPSTRSGRAVIAHELAHVTPPTGPGAVGGGGAGGGMPSSFSGPVLNENKRGDEDAAGAEAHERQAREVEGRVYAQEDAAGSAPEMATAPAAAGSAAPAEAAQIDPAALEAKVLSLISKWERTEAERAGAV